MKYKITLATVFGIKEQFAPQFFLIFLAATMVFSAEAVVTNCPSEYVTSHAWVVQNILATTNQPPFSFTYNSVASSNSNLFSSWVRLDTVTNIIDAYRQQYLLQWTNASDGLEVRCLAVEYSDFPAIEWTVYLTNAGPADTLMLQSIQGLNTSFSRGSGPEFVLNGNQGEYDSVNSFEPFQITLNPSSVNNFSPFSNSGRSCDGPNAWPYYDLQMPGGGIVLAIGWPGQWASSFTRDSGSNLNIQAGQQTTHLILHAGESIRTPLIVMDFWQSNDLLRAQNLWRHWYLSHVVPLVSNQPPSTVWQVQGGDVAVVNSYIQAGIEPDILWRDAGWYPDTNGPYTGVDSWLNTGTWEVNTNLYPNGFLPTSTTIAAEGVKFLLWFEPERIGDTNHSYLATNNLSWILPATPSTVGDILNEGNPGAFNWLTNHIQGLIVSNGIRWYREDMNGNGPLPAWQNNDATNRQGITENFYVQGHLAYWDDLLAMNPGLRIDACGSGGRRNDLEAMRRAVPLDRSDDKGIEDNQDQTYGSSSWLPFSGQGDSDYDSYNFRSYYLPSYGNGFNQVQQAYSEFRKISPIMLFGDYYPLTPYSQGLDQWIGWQFDRPSTGEGFLQAFRRGSNLVSSMTLQLRGLDPLHAYDVQDLDKGDLGWFTGNSLMTNGITIQVTSQPGSALIYYTNAYGVQLPVTLSPLNLGPLTVQFLSSAIAANGSTPTYSWDFGDGAQSTLQNPRHAYASFGRYLAQVQAADNLGNTTTSQVPVTVMGTNWHRMKISFSGYTGPETLSNFPALVVFGTNLTANGFSYNQMASTNGWDLVFLNSDGTRTLNYEIEKWATNGLSYVWLQVPSLTNNTTVWAYWGDPNLASAPAPCTTNGSVWVNNFSGVWHLPNGSTLSAADSTTNHINGGVSNATATVGQIDGAGLFNGGSSYIDLGAGPAVNPPAITYSAWVKPAGFANAYSSIISKAENGGRVGTLLLKSNGKLACYVEAAGTVDYDGTGNSTLNVNQWYYLTMTYDSVGGLRGYVNGALDGAAAEMGAVFTNATDSVWIGSHPTIAGRYFNGAIDEARLSSVARSTNWIEAEWLNTASNSIFNSYSIVTSNNIMSPGGFTATAVSASQINLAWTDDATNASGYLIERSTDDYNWNTVAGTAANASTYADTNGLCGGTLYYYRLSATNATGMSGGVVTNAITLGLFSAWQFASQISFSGYTKGETLTNFPALVNIGTNIPGFAWSQFVNNNGYELRFSDSAGNELPYERDRGTNVDWANSAGVGQVWVRVPQLNSATIITAYWGNQSATNSVVSYCTNGAVWSGGFGGVWHLPDGVTLDAEDSTSNQNNGAVTGAIAIPGEIDGAGSFNGSTAFINVGSAASVNPPAFTYSAWIKATTLTNAYSSVISKAENGNVGTLLLKSNGKLACYVSAGRIVDYDGTGSTTLSDGQWYYVTMAYDAANGLNGYVNGALDCSVAAEGPATTGADAIWVGAHPTIGGRYFNGVIDEARIATAARDANWVWAEWQNMASNNVFISYGNVGAANAPASFDQWREIYFNGQELADPSISGESASPNQDGVNNLLKYAFDLSPWNSDTSESPFVGEWIDPDTQLRYLTLTYRQNVAASDLIFTPKATDSLTDDSWSDGLPEISRTNDVGAYWVTVRDLIPMNNASQRYLRLDVGLTNE